MPEVEINLVQNEYDLQSAFSVRQQVFIQEQNVPEDLELDELDHHVETTHILARELQGRAVGTARMRPYKKGIAKVERVAVVSSYRGTGLGRRLMEFLEEEARKSGFREIVLNAQIQAQGFYERLGYQGKGEHFFEAGIEHIAMHKSFSG